MSTRFTIHDAIAVYLLDGEARRLTPATLEYYRYNLGVFARWAEGRGVTALAGLDANTVRAYMAENAGRGLAGHTLLAQARALRSWLNFCVREEWIAASPMQRMHMPRVDKTLLPSYTPEDVAALLKSCIGGRDMALVLFLLDTGVRASEAVALNAGDVDLSTGAVIVRQGKGRKQRMVYLGAKARRHLMRYLAGRNAAPTDPLWRSQLTGRRLTRNGLTQILRRLGRRAGVHCTAHRFRRTFALYCLRNGMDIYSLQRLMGHEDLTVLRRYLAQVETDLHTAHRQFGVVDNL